MRVKLTVEVLHPRDEDHNYEWAEQLLVQTREMGVDEIDLAAIFQAFNSKSGEPYGWPDLKTK